MTYWSRVSLISCGVGTCVIASATSRSSSSARISLQRAMHSLQMYTDGPEMNFRTESLDFPQNEQRRCLSCDMTDHSTGDADTQMADIQRISAGEKQDRGKEGYRRIKGTAPVKQETTQGGERLKPPFGCWLLAVGCW